MTQSSSNFGDVMYMRVDQNPDSPDMLLAGQTLYLAPGGMLDVLADRTSIMGLDRVGYTPGLRAQRKVGSDFITYRFEVAKDAPRGVCYLVQCRGENVGDGFSFSIQVE